MNFFQAKLGLAPSPLCRLCGVGYETITHFMAECPLLYETQCDIFLDECPTADMKWSVRNMLRFSYFPGVNDAFEGTWASGDPNPVGEDPHDESMGLGLLDEDQLDVNGNHGTTVNDDISQGEDPGGTDGNAGDQDNQVEISMIRARVSYPVHM